MHSYQHLLAEPLRLDSVELLRHPSADVWITRVRSGGLCGFSMANQHAQVVAPMFNLRVAPVFLGADVRDLWTLVERVYVTGGNYKLAGISRWTCVGYIETAAIDLLGRATARYAAELLGGVARKEVPVYLSSLRRDTTPEAANFATARRRSIDSSSGSPRPAPGPSRSRSAGA